MLYNILWRGSDKWTISDIYILDKDYDDIKDLEKLKVSNLLENIDKYESSDILFIDNYNKGTSRPSSAKQGWLWYDETNNVISYYNGSGWSNISINIPDFYKSYNNITELVTGISNASNKQTLADALGLKRYTLASNADPLVVSNFSMLIIDFNGGENTGIYLILYGQIVTIRDGGMTVTSGPAQNAATITAPNRGHYDILQIKYTI